MTKQTVELVYHDPETEKPELDPEFLDSRLSKNVLGFEGGEWDIMFYKYPTNSWQRVGSSHDRYPTVWIDMPPKPNKKVWVKKEVEPICKVNYTGVSPYENMTFKIPADARNIVCTYEIEEEQ